MANKNASPKVYAMERTAELQKSVPYYAALTLFFCAMAAVWPVAVQPNWNTNSTATAVVLMGAAIVFCIVLTLSVKELAKLREESHLPSHLYWFWVMTVFALAVPIACFATA